MNASTLHPLAENYLTRLKKAARRLPRTRRNELVEEIEAHLREALPAGAGEAEARDVLERLGEPEQIVSEAESGSGGELIVRAGMREWLAIPLLLLGGFILVFGWFVGLVLLWTSRVWTMRDKLIGTLVIPGGLSLAAFLALSVAATTGERSSPVCTAVRVPRPGEQGARFEHCAKTVSSGGINYGALVILIALAVLPILTSIYLTWRANRAATA